MGRLSSVTGVPAGAREATDGDAVALDSVSVSFDAPFNSEGLTAFGFWIGMADFCTVRAAIALALARWCGDREARII